MPRPKLEQQVTFLYTKDLEKTAAFYENTLQLPLVLDQGSCRIYEVCANGFLGFCDQGAASTEGPLNPKGVILTLVSQEVDAWHAYLLEHEVPIVKPPTFYETYNIYHLFLRDPNGYLIEIQTFKDPAWPKPNKG